MPEQRIVSLLPSATEIVCALGLQDALIGITHECDYPPGLTQPSLTASHIDHASLSSAAIDHAVRAQLDGHGSIYALDTPTLQALKPDLIITQELCDVCAVSYRTVQQAARMFETDVRVLSLEPTTIADIWANIRTVGELTGTLAAAERLIAQLDARLEAVARSVADLTYRPRTLLLEWLEPPFSPGHWVPEQIALAGGDASFGQAGQRSITTTAAAIQAYAPEVIVLIPCGFYKEDILRALAQAQLPVGWHELPAVQRAQVWAVDATAYFSRPGPRVVEGAEILAHILHPELVGPPTANEAVRVPAELMHSAV